MPKDRRLALPTLLVVAALTAAGCGDDGPSKDEYVADLNKVCRESNEKIQKIKRPRNIKEIGPFMRESRVVLQDSLKEAEKLELPDEDKKEFQSYIDANKKSLDVLDDIEQASAKNDTNAIRRLFGATTAENRKRDLQAKKLGLNECGSG